MPNHCYYLVFSFTNHRYLYSYIYSLAMHLRYSSAPLVDNNWRASVASETLTGVKMGMFVYIYGRTYVILYFDPPYFCVRSAFDPVPNFTKQNPPV